MCKRCSRLGHYCSYDVPRARGSSKSSKPVASTDPIPPSLRGTDREQLASPVPPLRHNEIVAVSSAGAPVPPLSRPSEFSYLGIPTALVSNLIELFYANVYNATLLLHKATFLSAVAAGTACNHTVLSVCAWGAKYDTIPARQNPIGIADILN